MADRPPVVALFGATALGKSEVALELAELLGADIVVADSMQIYAGLPIVTNQPDEAARSRVAHHLVGWASPQVEYSVAEYAARAHAVVDGLLDAGRPVDRRGRLRPLPARRARRPLVRRRARRGSAARSGRALAPGARSACRGAEAAGARPRGARRRAQRAPRRPCARVARRARRADAAGRAVGAGGALSPPALRPAARRRPRRTQGAHRPAGGDDARRRRPARRSRRRAPVGRSRARRRRRSAYASSAPSSTAISPESKRRSV